MSRFEKFLLNVLFIELFIGGGGRLIDFGILSIRQVLYILLFCTFIFRLIKTKSFFNKEVNTFVRFTPVTIGVYILIGWCFISAVIGWIYDHPLSAVITDLLRVSYIAIYFPLAYYINNSRFSITHIIKIIKYSALTVAIFTITITLLGKTIFINNFNNYYNFLNTIMNDDLFFRPSNSVFYKSHFYVLIGLILSLNAALTKKHSKVDLFNIFLCTLSIIWSETRGFLLAFMVSILAILLIDTKIITDPVKGLKEKIRLLGNSKFFLKKSAILLIVFISVPILYQTMTLSRFQIDTADEQVDNSGLKYGLEEKLILGSKGSKGQTKERVEVNDVSVNTRMSFILASKDILLSNPVNFIFGTGYGTEIDGRISGIEMSFLDILVEQGLIGLCIWGFLFMIVYINFYIVYKRQKTLNTTDISFMSIFLGVLLLTNINPFINNPIGMGFMLIVLIYSQIRKDEVKTLPV